MPHEAYALKFATIAIPFILTASFTAAARMYGLKSILPTLVSIALSLVLITVNQRLTNPDNWILIAVMAAAGVAVSITAFIVMDIFKKTESTAAKISYFRDNKQYIVILSAFSIAIIVTPLFSSLADWVDQKGFWFGFYQSWTAGLVTFIFLGIAGILVSVYRPSQDQFKRRVSHLFDVNDTAAIDHLASSVQKNGYYAKTVKRTYTIENYSHEQKAYKISITHEAVHKNFLWDVSAPDQATIKLTLTEEDKLNPPLDSMGSIISVRINDNERLTRPEPIPEQGIDKIWPYTIQAGGEGHIRTIHYCYYKANEPHSFGVNRFARHIKSEIIYNCTDDGVPDITIKTGNLVRTERLVRGHPIVMADAKDYVPGADAFEFTLSEPN
ncbi:hypothetical protein FBZ85_101486 [Azospirillum brasilense]|nr:hypothetical protein [Azospirillum baldaniorum]TWA83737.1 hypothetical protein FBZ85_101486 [Azospirillum brasilense]